MSQTCYLHNTHIVEVDGTAQTANSSECVHFSRKFSPIIFLKMMYLLKFLFGISMEIRINLLYKNKSLHFGDEMAEWLMSLTVDLIIVS